jgi:hypothetical protein
MFKIVSAEVNSAPGAVASIIQFMGTAGFVIPLFSILLYEHVLLAL